MSTSRQHVEAVTESITAAIGDSLNWQWESDRGALLAEFARDKKERTLAILMQKFPDHWDKKSIKLMPKSLKSQLAVLTKLTKEQYLFTIPATSEQPTILAIWWPWGHGATISLRLMVLTETYTSPTPKR